jgi:hypothetical protein
MTKEFKKSSINLKRNLAKSSSNSSVEDIPRKSRTNQEDSSFKIVRRYSDNVSESNLDDLLVNDEINIVKDLRYQKTLVLKNSFASYFTLSPKKKIMKSPKSAFKKVNSPQHFNEKFNSSDTSHNLKKFKTINTELDVKLHDSNTAFKGTYIKINDSEMSLPSKTEKITTKLNDMNLDILKKLSTNNFYHPKIKTKRLSEVFTNKDYSTDKSADKKKKITINNNNVIISKTFRNMPSISRIENNTRHDDSDSVMWNKTFFDKKNDNIEGFNSVQLTRKDTIFLDMKNISGELGIANTRLSNNSIYPFKSQFSKFSSSQSTHNQSK